jgi:carotenoid cleavage dioxygenase
LITAHDDDETVVAYAVTPSLERWTLHCEDATIHRAVLDPTPQQFARSNKQLLDAPIRYCWSVADSATHKHDLITGGRETHAFQPGDRPGDFVFITDQARSNDEDGGWLIGLLQHAGNETTLVVLDAAELARPPVAAVRIPRRIPQGAHALWIPSTH